MSTKGKGEGGRGYAPLENYENVGMLKWYFLHLKIFLAIYEGFNK